MKRSANVIFYTLIGLICANVYNANAQTPHPSDPNYTLVWSDEFDTDGAANSDNWFYQTQCIQGTSGSATCWANGEAQHYTGSDDDNAVVDGGVLKITAKREDFNDQGRDLDYTSARLNSKFAFTYGRVDVSAKLPSELGTWPAIWMLGRDINEDGGYWDATHGTTNWPAIGEIDIMEQKGTSLAAKNEVIGTIHGGESEYYFRGGSTNDVTAAATAASTSTTAFHTYSTIWTEDEIQFLIDDILYYTYNPVDEFGVQNSQTWPFDSPQYILLNVAMGGSLGGTIPSDFTSGTMEVDYVRVYQVSDGGLVSNGDFENGGTSWFTNYGDNTPEIRTEGGNSFFFADTPVTTNVYDQNLSQALAITQGEDYILSFDASTGAGNTRTIVAGIGLNEQPFSSAAETITLTDQTQTYTLYLNATGFGSANSRVLFDIGGATSGVVVID